MLESMSRMSMKNIMAMQTFVHTFFVVYNIYQKWITLLNNISK